MSPDRPTGSGATHILFVVNTDWFFLSHRLPLAQEALRRGWRVTLAAPDTGHFETIEAHGIDAVDVGLSRAGTNPLLEVRAVGELSRLYRRLLPDIIHHVAAKPVVFGSLASRAVPRTPVVNAVSGLGYAFIGKPWWHPLPRVVPALYRSALRRPRTWAIFQNGDDAAFFHDRGLVAESRSVFIRGSGVDLEAFPFEDEPEGTPVVLLPARLLWDKGVGEFVEAARALKERGVEARFALVGKLDSGNPAAVPEADLEEWITTGVVEWWGYRADMPAVYRAATVVTLPSYREGLPKVLLEAGATGRAIVTTDVPGCRDVVEDGETGLVVPPRDAGALAGALGRLLEGAGERDALRRAARRSVAADHAVQRVVEQHFELYDRVLGGGRPS